MGRLIDADLLKQCYTGKNSLGATDNDSKADYASIRKMIDSQPTAYDVDKVVEQLQKSNHNYYPSIDSYCVSEKAVKLKDAIEIVKGAVKE